MNTPQIARHEIKEYLVKSAKEKGAPWRDKRALDKTVEDVLALDEDLKKYALEAIQGNETVGTTIACEVTSISQLLGTGEFTPVTAALLIQWYRNDPKKAAAFLLQRDTIINLPEQSLETSSESEAADEVQSDEQSKG